MGLYIGNNKYKVMIGNQRGSFVTEDSLLPAGYVQLEYIESTGTQYIDTGLKWLDGDEFGLTYKQVTLDASYRSLFGATENGMYYKFYISQTNSTSYVGNLAVHNIPRDKNRHTLSWIPTPSSSQYIVIDGITYACSTPITLSHTLNVMVFARNANDSKMIGKVYGYYQKHNGEYKINLIPAKNSNNIIGMYDIVTGTFLTNAGTGDFIAGPRVNN